MAKLCEFGDRITTMSPQEIFDEGAKHLLTQKQKSLREKTVGDADKGAYHHKVGDVCLYDGPEGICCGAAPFLPEYNSALEGKGILAALTALGVTLSRGREKLLSALQAVHDVNPVDRWDKSLREVAVRYNLKFNSEYYYGNSVQDSKET